MVVWDDDNHDGDVFQLYEFFRTRYCGLFLVNAILHKSAGNTTVISFLEYIGSGRVFKDRNIVRKFSLITEGASHGWQCRDISKRIKTMQLTKIFVAANSPFTG